MTSPLEDTTRAIGEHADSWTDIIVDAIEGRLAELHSGLPAKVVDFDPGKQSCDVQPLLQRVYIDENEAPQRITIPVIANVPIVYPAGGGWSITWPLAVDDIVYLAFAERSLDDWLNAPTGTLVTPSQTRKHDLSDAICIPGIRPRSSPIPNVSTTNLRIASDDGSVVVECTPDTVRIKAPKVVIDSGGAADSAIVRGDQLAEYLITKLSVGTAFGPSGPSIVPLVAGVELSATGKVK